MKKITLFIATTAIFFGCFPRELTFDDFKGKYVVYDENTEETNDSNMDSELSVFGQKAWDILTKLVVIWRGIMTV